MKEVKTPKKTLIFYCIITLLVLLIFNTLLYPAMLNRAVQQVDYSTFLQMVRDGKVKQVEVARGSNHIHRQCGTTDHLQDRAHGRSRVGGSPGKRPA